MDMEAGLDTGPVLLEKRVPILDTRYGGSLTEKLAGMGAAAIVEALERSGPPCSRGPRKPPAPPTPPRSRRRRRRSTGIGTRPTLHRQVRAFNPFPGAETILEGESLKVWEACPRRGVRAAGHRDRPRRRAARRCLWSRSVGAHYHPETRIPPHGRRGLHPRARPMPPGTRLGVGEGGKRLISPRSRAFTDCRDPAASFLRGNETHGR